MKKIIIPVLTAASILILLSACKPKVPAVPAFIVWDNPMELPDKKNDLPLPDQPQDCGSKKEYTFINTAGKDYFEITVQNTGSCPVTISIKTAAADGTEEKTAQTDITLDQNAEIMDAFKAPPKDGKITITVTCGSVDQKGKCSFKFRMSGGTKDAEKGGTIHIDGLDITDESFQTITGGSCDTKSKLELQILNNTDAELTVSSITVTNKPVITDTLFACPLVLTGNISKPKPEEGEPRPIAKVIELKEPGGPFSRSVQTQPVNVKPGEFLQLSLQCVASDIKTGSCNGKLSNIQIK
jgi:hypothetical protein